MAFINLNALDSVKFLANAVTASARAFCQKFLEETEHSKAAQYASATEPQDEGEQVA